jgi:hypothetical protein
MEIELVVFYGPDYCGIIVIIVMMMVGKVLSEGMVLYDVSFTLNIMPILRFVFSSV